MGLLVFLLMSLVSAVVWHCYVGRYLVASFGAAITSAVAFQGAAFLELGYLDPFFAIALVLSSVLGFVVALLVGLLFRACRKR